MVARDLKAMEDTGTKIIVRVHSVSVHRSTMHIPPPDASPLTSTIKLSMLPLPCKHTLLRSKAQANDGSKKLFFDFEKKSASLVMSSGDFRSRLYKEGSCPRVQLEVSAMGQIFCAALYLPAALGAHLGQTLVIPMLPMDVTDNPAQCSVLVEFLPGSPDGPAGEALSADQVRMAFDVAKKRTSPGNCTITAEISGFPGYDGEPSGLRLEAALCASGVKTALALEQSFSYGTGFAQKSKLSLVSTSPALDLLELRLFKGLSPDDELGRVVLPLAAVFDFIATKSAESINLLEYKAFSFDEGSSTFRLSGWSVATALAAADFKAPVYTAPAKPAEVPIAAPTPSDAQATAAAAALAAASLLTPSGNVPRNTTPAISGVLTGCMQGFILRARQQKSLEKNDEVTVDITLQPEGLRKAAGPSNPVKSVSSSSDVSATVEFQQGRGFSMPLTWSMQQRQVSFLKIGLNVNVGGKGKPMVLGNASLDLASFVSTSFATATFLVPIRDRAAVAHSGAAAEKNDDDARNIIQDQDVFGWLMMALQFTPGGRVSAAKSDAQTEVEGRIASMWVKLADGTLSLRALGLANVESPASNQGENTSGAVGLSASSSLSLIKPPPALSPASAPPPPPTALQVVLSPLDIPATAANNILMEGESICLQLRVGSDPTLVPAACGASSILDVMATVQNNQLAWSLNPCLLAAACSDELDRSLSCMLYLYLLRVNTISGSRRVFAESVIVVPREIIQIGMPFELSVPVRDKDGGKVAIANLSIHTSSLHSVSREGDNNVPETTSSEKNQDVNIFITCDGGNVRDASWRSQPLEPFFECSLIPPPALANSVRVLACKLQDRTSFLSAKVAADDKNTKSWGLSCRLSLPLEYLPQTPAEESSPKWILAIVCRDAARYGCPEVCWSRMGIPWGALLRKESFAEWFTMTPSSPSRSESSTAGRVQVSITRLNPEDWTSPTRLPGIVPRAASPDTTGIGTLALWLQSITEMRAGNEEAQLVMTSATAASFVPGVASKQLPQEENLQPFAEVLVGSDPSSAGSFSQAVPVAGGEGEVRLKISTTSSKAAFVASFPIMAGVTRGPQVNLVAPSLELMLTDEWEANDGPASAAQGAKRGTKRPPRLSLSLAFVPFVRGQLVVTIGDLNLVETISQKFPPDVARRAAVRAVMGTATHIYSDPFDLKDAMAGMAGTPPASTSSSKASSPPGPIATFSLPVDTFAAASTSNSILALTLSLLDLDSVGETGSAYCLAAGELQTAPLYYQAVRAAAGSSTAVAASTAVGTSPVFSLALPLLDPISRRQIGQASVSVQFLMAAASEGVSAWIDGGMNTASASGDASSTMELTLKQSFRAADADNSGQITSDELLRVIVNGRAAKSKARQGPPPAGLTPPDSQDSAIDMLLSLAGPEFAALSTSPDGKINMSDAVRHIFGRLDVDGDGSISWWEWRRVLMTSLRGRSVASVYCNPKDALCIGLSAAADAVRIASAPTAAISLPFVRVNIKQDAAQSEAEAQALDDLPPDLPLAKAVPRLQNMVRSLRLSNNTLQKRLERAIIESQALGIPAPSSEAAPGAVDPAAAATLQQEIFRAKQRAQDAMTQQQAALKSLEFEKQRGQQLEMELSKVRRANELSSSQTATQNNAKLAAAQKLQQEIAQHKQNLDKLNDQKKKKMGAVVLLAMWFRKKVLPYVRNNIRERVKKQLSRQLGGMIKKKKAEQEQARKNEAATKLKSGFRGMKDRRKVMKMKDEVVEQHASATKIQTTFRCKRAREFVRKLMLQKVTAAFSKKYQKASVVQRALLRWLNYKRGQKDLARKRLEKLRLQEAAEKQAAAALAVQAASTNHWQQFHDTKLLLRPAFKPHSKDCVGYWVSLGGGPEAGLVLALDPTRRLVQVLFNDGRSQSKDDDQQIDLPFDHPKLAWFLEPSRAESLALAVQQDKKGQEGEDEDEEDGPGEDNDSEATEVELEEVDRPPIEKAAPGYMISYFADDLEGETRIGNVTGSDPRNRTIAVVFNGQADPTSPRVDTISYDHPNLLWYSDDLFHQKKRQKDARSFAKQLSKVPRPLLSKAMGYTVEVVSHEPDADIGDMFLGRVIRIDKDRRTVFVQFECEEGEEPDVEEMGYMSRDIAWIEAPVIPATLALSYVPRPALNDCVGYSVEMRAEGDDAEQDDMYIGKISRVNLKDNTFEVAFEVDGPDGQLSFDHEWHPYTTDLVAWMSPPPPIDSPRPVTRKVRQTITHREPCPRPDAYGPHLVGRSVDFLVYDDIDDTKDIYAAATVVSLEDKRRSIVIRLEEAEDVGDTEKMPWKSKDVRWVQVRKEVVLVEVPFDAPAPAEVGPSLKAAASAGEVAIVKAFIAEWNWHAVLSWADAGDDGSKTPLHVACENGHVAVVRALLDKKTHGVDVNKADAMGSTALLWASGRGSDDDKREIIKLLLAAPGVDVNKSNVEECTPLLAAVTAGVSVECVKMLLACKGIEVNRALKDGRNALMISCLGSHTETAALLLSHENVNLAAESKQGMTALYIASASGNVEVVKMLLAHPAVGPIVNAPDALGFTPLIVACSLQKAASVKLLIAAPGIDLNRVNKKGLSALAVACKTGSTDCVKSLLSCKGIEVDAKSLLDLAANDEIKALLRPLVKPVEPATAPTPAATPVAFPTPAPVVETTPAPAATLAPAASSACSSLDGLPWVRGKSASPSELYSPGDGLVISVDGGRFFPDNVTLSRVCLKVFDDKKTPCGKTFEVTSSLLSPAASPLFGLKAEVWQGQFSGSETCLLRIDTIDRTSKIAVVLGYACFPLFVDGSGRQSEAPGSPFFISKGGFQVPLHLPNIPAQDRFSDKMLALVPRVPCASLLVRISKAPPAQALSATPASPQPSEDIAAMYAAGTYDGLRCEPSEVDHDCYRARRPGGNVESALRDMSGMPAGPEGSIVVPPAPAAANELVTWRAALLALLPPAGEMRRTTDSSYVAPYSASAGVSVSVDLLFNMPDTSAGLVSSAKPHAYRVLYSISAPPAPMLWPPLFTRADDMNACSRAPVFLDGFQTLKPAALGAQSFLVVEVRSAVLTAPKAGLFGSGKKEPAAASAAVEEASDDSSWWTLMPLSMDAAGDAYVVNGTFQLPLIKGPVPLGDFWTGSKNPLEQLFARLGKPAPSVGRPLRLAVGSSVILRVCNPLLKSLYPDLLQRPADAPVGINASLLERIIGVTSDAATGLSIPTVSMYAFDPKRYPAGTKTVAMQFGKSSGRSAADVGQMLNEAVEKMLAAGKGQSWGGSAGPTPATPASTVTATPSSPPQHAPEPLLQAVPRPPLTSRIIGHIVEVQARLFDKTADEGDYDRALIVSVDEGKKTIHVVFEGDNHRETLPHDSKAIDWFIEAPAATQVAGVANPKN